MGNKNTFNPAQTSGVQYFWTNERVTVLHRNGAYLPHIEPGEVLLVETKPVGDLRMFWFGRVTKTAYCFVLDEPVSIFDVDSWYRHQQEMNNVHDANLDEFNDMQGELPF